MKTTMLLLAVFLGLAAPAGAQSPDEDVIYLKNGGVMRGTILELVPEQSVKLQTKDGNVFVHRMADVERIAKEPVSDLPGERNSIESWYLYFALGYAHPTYPGALDGMLDQLASLGSQFSVSMDVPGIYAPLSDRKTLLGGVINAVGDRYEVNSRSLQLNAMTIGFSAMHFLTGEIGDGVFLRGDVGIARIQLDAEGDTETSDAGLGTLIGGGFAFPVSSETRLLLNLNYANRAIEGERYGAVSVNLGVLL